MKGRKGSKILGRKGRNEFHPKTTQSTGIEEGASKFVLILKTFFRVLL